MPIIVDRLSGEIRKAQIFVAVLGASSFTFARATWTQALADWIDAHIRAFQAIDGVPPYRFDPGTYAAAKEGLTRRSV